MQKKERIQQSATIIQLTKPTLSLTERKTIKIETAYSLVLNLDNPANLTRDSTVTDIVINIKTATKGYNSPNPTGIRSFVFINQVSIEVNKTVMVIFNA